MPKDCVCSCPIALAVPCVTRPRLVTDDDINYVGMGHVYKMLSGSYDGLKNVCTLLQYPTQIPVHSGGLERSVAQKGCRLTGGWESVSLTELQLS